MKRIITIGVICFSAVIFGCSDQPNPDARATIEQAEESPSSTIVGVTLWVKTDRLDRHTCPSKECGIVGQLFFREAATLMEERDGWVRITNSYDAMCESEESRYVDKGKESCTSDNGIIDGKFAEWVERANLSDVRPLDPAEEAKADEALVAQSDDFKRHRRAFVKLARQLIDNGRCTAADLTEQGGFVKSVGQHKNEPIYFTYCGGMSLSNKIYVNAVTGEVLP